MATVSTPVDALTPEVRAALPPGRVLADIGLVAARNLRKVARNSRLIVFSTASSFFFLGKAIVNDFPSPATDAIGPVKKGPGSLGLLLPWKMTRAAVSWTSASQTVTR